MKRPKLKKLIPKRKAKQSGAKVAPLIDDESVPRITNETVAEHREKVLGSARKYIYPLQHSKHKIVLISTGLFIAALISFFTYCTLSLYRFKSTSGFLYGVTRVIPFPIAKAGPDFVAYENYLFELRHYIHYYQTQQKVNFNDTLGKQQLANYQTVALQKVIDDAYIKELAAKNHVSVSDSELNNEIDLVRSQNRLGANEKGFEDILKDNFGWTINDFKRSLRQEMLGQKLVAALDKSTSDRAQQALNEINGGAIFGDVAKKYSDDGNSKGKGGDYGFLVDKTNRDISAQVTQTLFELKPGQTSGIINTGLTLEIVKNLGLQNGKIHAAHIVFTLKDINVYLNPIKDKQKTRLFVRL
ncbi:MAG: peptidylprolyl isomerase [Candidatus Saccharimonadales bacterium]